MAIIYTYPVKTTPANDDLILISDSADNNKTKQIKVSSLPGGSSSGVSSLNTLTNAVTITGGTNVTLNTVGNNIEINAAGGGGTPSAPLNSVQFNNNSAFGGSPNLTFTTDTLTVKDNVIIQGDGTTDAGKLKLNCYDNSHHIELIGPDHGGSAASYSVKFPATGPGGNQKILQSDASGVLSWINTPSSGGGGSVDSVNTTDGTYINLTPNSATQGAVTVTADLSAVDGTSAFNTRFLSKDNTWDVISPAGLNTQIQYNNNGSFSSSGDFKYDDSAKVLTIGDQDVNRGIISIAGGSSGAGELRLGDPGTSGGTVTLKGGNDHSTSYTIKLPDDGPYANNKILESDASGNLSWINTPTDTTYSAGTGLALNGTTFSLASGAALTNLGGGTGTTFLRKDGTWATPQDANTNIANTNLQLDNSRNLDLSNGDAADYALSFISTLGGASKNLFKFDQIGGTSPRFTAGHTESAYEGYVVLEGNGSNRTGILQFQNAAGTYYTSFQAPNTFGANQNIGYVLPSLQGAANSVLTNNGSGTLSWAATPEFSNSGTGSSFSDATLSVEQANGGSGNFIAIAAKVNQYQGSRYASFFYGSNASEIGSISANFTNAVSYNTSSDYRLKENVVEMTGAVERVKQLKPNRFNFISDPSDRIVDGFLAHEVSVVVPEAITGDKDAVDADGKPIYQGIDQSKLVPLLVGAIKELTARIEALEA